MGSNNRIHGLALTFFTFFLVTASAPPSSRADDLLNRKAPDFKLTDCDGNEMSLGNFAGKVIVLNFWRTTCFPCLEEMPDLAKIYEEYQGKGVVVIGVAVNDKISDVRNKLDVLRIPYPMAMDNMAIRLTYGINSVPHTFIIDRSGIIRDHFDKQTEKNVIEEAIKPLLQQKQPAEAE